MKKAKVVFMATPTFSVPILEMLIENSHVVAVVSQPDKEVGRKKELRKSPVKECALSHNIPVITPIKIKTEYEEILAFQPDLIVTCAYGQILPKEILDYPKLGCINVHASLLPKYRGGAPIQHSIMNGESKTGITIMSMDEGMDTGDMIISREVLIDFTDTYDSLSKKLSQLGTELLQEILPDLLEKKIKKQKQDHSLATYAKIITRQDEQLDFNKTALEVYNHIRSLSSTPGSFAYLDGKIIKIYEARIGKHMYSTKKNGEIVQVYSDGLGVSTRDVEIVITEIKPEGKRRMTVKEFLNGKDKDSFIGKVWNEVEPNGTR